MDNPFLPSYSMRPVVIANGRSLQSDAVINGYHVPKGVSFCGKRVTFYAGTLLQFFLLF